MTESPLSFATQTCVPSDATASGSLSPLVGAASTATRAPVEASSSVTESPRSFATQTCVPSEAIAYGKLNR